MRPTDFFALTVIVAGTALAGGVEITAQATAEIPSILITPDKVDSRIGTLEFKDGAPNRGSFFDVAAGDEGLYVLFSDHVGAGHEQLDVLFPDPCVLGRSETC